MLNQMARPRHILTEEQWYDIQQLAESMHFEVEYRDNSIVFTSRVTNDETEEIDVAHHFAVYPQNSTYHTWLNATRVGLEKAAMEQDGVAPHLTQVSPIGYNPPMFFDPEPPGGHDELNRIMLELLMQKEGE